MKATVFSLLLLAFAGSAGAQERGSLGGGVLVGSNNGGTAKYWTSGSQAADIAIGYGGNLIVHADYLWHAWDVLPAPRAGKLAAYAGLGGRFRNRAHDDVEFGFRTPLGAAYWLARHPVELFVELVPVFKLNADTGLDLDGAVGLRVYFGR